MPQTNAERDSWSGLLIEPPDTFWKSLRYFNAYRLGVASVFLLAFGFYGVAFNLGYEHPVYYGRVCIAYLLLAVFYYFVPRVWRHWFSLQLTLQVLTDITVLTLLMYYSGGTRSGLTFMMVVVLAGAGLVGQGRLSPFFAALATLAVLLEQFQRVLHLDGDLADFTQTGIVSIGFFATALTARRLARRVVINETLAHERGQQLADQLLLNERVIRDMQDGVLVVDGAGRVRQSNPQARLLLGLSAAEPHEFLTLTQCSTLLAERYRCWAHDDEEKLETLPIPATGRVLQARFLPGGERGQALIYLEDMNRAEEQARQVKLAALGRLTANMAHEIRNPLAAISHAAELLVDEQREATRARLVQIIGDNTQRLNRLVVEVLELGQRDRAQPEWLSLAAFLDVFLEEFALQDACAQRCVVLSPAVDVTIWFDRCHLNRVLWNLLSNALRHSHGEVGSVRLEVRRGHLVDGRAGIELHVIDDGAGVEPALQVQIFEPFFTTRSHGTGLGLYIARELCEANGASLEFCENAPGAHFCLRARCAPEAGGANESGT
ncbi:MAG: hypothetical protein RL695_1626 [Pseudomonadota bacterium]